MEVEGIDGDGEVIEWKLEKFIKRFYIFFRRIIWKL